MGNTSVVAETCEIQPRYYGVRINRRVFVNPSTSALAYVAITSPERNGGLRDMLAEWQQRKIQELEGKVRYAPLFKIPLKHQKHLLRSSRDELGEIVRKAVKKNHGSFNLFDCYGKDAVDTLKIYGETLTAEVKSQKSGTYTASLKGAFLGPQGELRRTEATCSCRDSIWMETKGGLSITHRRECIHVKAMETEYYLQRTALQQEESLPPRKSLAKEKDPHDGKSFLMFNFVDNEYLRPLITDILVAHEVLRESLYSLDRKLLSPEIGPWIMPVELQQQVYNQKNPLTFEILKQKNVERSINREILHAQNLVENTFFHPSGALFRDLKNHGYHWSGYCLELGQPAARFENDKYSLSLCIDQETGLPFYAIKALSKGKASNSPFIRDGGPQHPFQQPTVWHRRLDDRTKIEAPTRILPAVMIDLPDISNKLSLRYQFSSSVIDQYREVIEKNHPFANALLKELKIEPSKPWKTRVVKKLW